MNSINYWCSIKNDHVEASVWKCIEENIQFPIRIYVRSAVREPVWTNIKDSVYDFAADYFQQNSLTTQEFELL
jgi:hypothetical protein